MLHDGRAIKVAVIGGSRVPFCRSHSIYRDCSNLELMTAALNGLVTRFDLKGQTLGDVALGAVIKHSTRLESGARIRDRMRSVTAHPGCRPAAGLRHQS